MQNLKPLVPFTLSMLLQECFGTAPSVPPQPSCEELCYRLCGSRMASGGIVARRMYNSCLSDCKSNAVAADSSESDKTTK